MQQTFVVGVVSAARPEARGSSFDPSLTRYFYHTPRGIHVQKMVTRAKTTSFVQKLQSPKTTLISGMEEVYSFLP